MKYILIALVLSVTSVAGASDLKLEMSCGPYLLNGQSLGFAPDSIWSQPDEAGNKQYFLKTPAETNGGVENYRLLYPIINTGKYTIYRAEETGVVALIAKNGNTALLQSNGGTVATCKSAISGN